MIHSAFQHLAKLAGFPGIIFLLTGILLVSATPVATEIPGQSRLDRFFDDANAFFKSHVADKLVDYDAIQKDPAALNALVTTIAEIDPEKLPSPEARKAFLINAYNLLVIRGVLDHYPLKSPLDVEGFFKSISYNVGGRQMTLDDIENKEIRPVYNDARIHFALVCAARGCPPIIPGAYFPSRLDAQLQQRTIRMLNDEHFLRVDNATKSVALSEIFKWFESDFKIKHNSLIDYINQFRKQAIPGDYQIGFYSYDWQLNAK